MAKTWWRWLGVRKAGKREELRFCGECKAAEMTREPLEEGEEMYEVEAVNDEGCYASCDCCGVSARVE